MQILKPFHKILDLGLINYDAPKMAEYGGRQCYQSTHKITDDSWRKFVENIVKRRHTSVLEHGPVYLEVPVSLKFPLYVTELQHVMQSPYSVVDTSNYCTKRDTDLDDPEYFGCNGCSGIQRVYTNLRVIFEHSPTIFEAIMTGGPLPEHVSFFTPESNDPHRRLTVEFIVDRGVTHELVRHRVLSFSQESTRYCNYSSGQFGSELTFIEPFFFATDEESRIWQYYEWQAACEVAESSYLRLIELGASPQEARSVLPNSLKSNLVMTGNLNQWRAFFKLRTPSDAHPQMREVAIPLYEEMRTLYPCITLD